MLPGQHNDLIFQGPIRRWDEAVPLGNGQCGCLQRDLAYDAIYDLRSRYHPGEVLDCRLLEFDTEQESLKISVKEVEPNPFIGADDRHPVGGVFCNLNDNTICLCQYLPQNFTKPFKMGDRVFISIKAYNYERQLIFGKIVSAL